MELNTLFGAVVALWSIGALSGVKRRADSAELMDSICIIYLVLTLLEIMGKVIK